MDAPVFIASAVAIIVSGTLLARFSDIIADKTGIGGVWFGAVAVAFVTSLPELVTDVSAVRQDAVDLALGDLFGSGMANMAILGLVTLAFHTRRLLQRVALENVLTASLAVSLTSIAALFLVGSTSLKLGPIGLGTLLIAAVYILGGFALRGRQVLAETEEERRLVGEVTLARAGLGFLGAAVVILISGPFLAQSSTNLADSTGLGQTFFGTLSLALVTSLPELAVAVSAVRIGALNLAIGNLMGSNAANMALLLPLDLAYTKGDLLAVADASVAVAALGGILLTTIGTTAIAFRAERKTIPVDPAAVALLVVYVLTLALVFDSTH